MAEYDRKKEEQRRANNSGSSYGTFSEANKKRNCILTLLNAIPFTGIVICEIIYITWSLKCDWVSIQICDCTCCCCDPDDFGCYIWSVGFMIEFYMVFACMVKCLLQFKCWIFHFYLNFL